MPAQNYYKDVKHVVYISTNIGTGCEHCHGVSIGLDDFAKSVNHYVEQHSYKVLHVGQETGYDMDGKPWHSTVAVLGR